VGGLAGVAQEGVASPGTSTGASSSADPRAA
jgi:hypothetical protein